MITYLNNYSTPDFINHPFLTSNGLQPLKKDTWLDYHQFHNLKNALNPLSFISRDSQLNPCLGAKQVARLKSLGLNLSFTKDNRPVFLASQNTDFMTQLGNMGFFNVFLTNHGKFGVQLSQVLMFLEHGISWVRNKFIMPGHLYNIHHLNQDVCDNRPHNLDVLPVDVHSFITSLQVGKKNVPTNLYSHNYLLSIFSMAPLTTKDGKEVKGKTQWLSRLSQVIRTTLITSTAFCIQSMAGVKLPDLDGCSDASSLFGAMVELSSSLGLVPGTASFLRSKSIPSLNSIQTCVSTWYKQFNDYLENSTSNVVQLFGGRTQWLAA